MEVKIIEGKHLGSFGLIGNTPPGTCPECAIKHNPEQPHDKQSLFYQYKFYNEHGCWPTWLDAMAHCSPETQELWKTELRKHGMEI